MEVINEIIHMNILLIKKQSGFFFYIGENNFRTFLTVIFYTFIFVKDVMHEDFLCNQRNTTDCMAV